MMKPSSHLVLLFYSFSLSFFACFSTAQSISSTNSTALFHVGVVLDLNSTVGKVAQSCISMAIPDFYAVHEDYNSRIVLHVRYSKGDVVGAAFAAIDLMKNVEVQAIIGPQRSAEAKFVINLGERVGNLIKKPISTMGNTLRIGVPVKNGFREFIEVKWDSKTNMTTHIGGFSIDVFRGVLRKLPFAVINPHFIPYMNVDGSSASSYDNLVYEVYLKKFDAEVGDTTIVANQSFYVDFTIPYSESGVSMVVPIKHKQENGSIFLKHLNWNLWLITGISFIFTGVVWILEHPLNRAFRGRHGQQLEMMLWFAQRERVVNYCTRFVLIIWTFVVLILTQSYTASLTSMLTVQSLQPRVIKEGCYVGYQTDSFVKGFLTEKLNFNESILKNYSTIEEYHDAFTKGCENGGVAAIFDEISNIKLFLAKYGSKYTMVGPIYKTDGFGFGFGFGFVFPLNSPLVTYISRAILNFTNDQGEMK